MIQRGVAKTAINATNETGAETLLLDKPDMADDNGASMPETTTPKVMRDDGGKFLPGVSGNPGGYPASMREVVKLAREVGPEAIARLTDLMRTSPDDRIAIAAAMALLERGYGKPQAPPAESAEQANVTGRIDLSKLDQAEFRQFRDLCAKATKAGE